MSPHGSVPRRLALCIVQLLLMPAHFSTFGSDTTVKAISVLILHPQIVLFPDDFHWSCCLAFVSNILHIEIFKHILFYTQV